MICQYKFDDASKNTCVHLLKFLPFGLRLTKYDRFNAGDVGESPTIDHPEWMVFENYSKQSPLNQCCSKAVRTSRKSIPSAEKPRTACQWKTFFRKNFRTFAC